MHPPQPDCTCTAFEIAWKLRNLPCKPGSDPSDLSQVIYLLIHTLDHPLNPLMQQHHPAAAWACTGTTNAAHPLAVKWDSYYSKGPPGTGPFDSARPSSQLQDYLCKCLMGRTSDSRKPCDAAAVAGQAQLYIPSEGDRQQGGLHSCEQCRQHKPRKGEDFDKPQQHTCHHCTQALCQHSRCLLIKQGRSLS